MIEELHALTAQGLMGCVQWDRRTDQLSFSYEEEWRRLTGGFPLSLSMPMTRVRHAHRVVEAFLWGLLPDSDGILRRWGERFHVSPRHAFQLLVHVGEECAGAVQFVRPERAARWRQHLDTGSIQWMDETEIATRMHLLLQDHSSFRLGGDAGHFSLAGAQPKTGFIHDLAGGRWGVPSGTIPTTHIFKPATGTFAGYAENEHFCLRLATALGLRSTASTVRFFGGVPVMVVERYDRALGEDRVTRIHQEDFCQALARFPQVKYQNQGGPSAREIVSVLREHSTRREEDVARFVDALLFHWLIGGTDAHAKNYSLLIAPQNQIRLAPLYDLSSALPYPQQIPPRAATLAMKIGGKYKLQAIGAREWEKQAAELKIDFEALRARLLHLAEMLPDAAAIVGATMRGEGIQHEVIGTLSEALSIRAQACRAAIS